MADLSSSFSKVCEQFKFSELNKHQKEAIISVVLKKKDVFVSLPTGFGKSVIFQALPMVFDGFTGESGHIVIVVSPLLSLIKDQTERLRQVGISCVSLSDVSMQGETKQAILDVLGMKDPYKIEESPEKPNVSYVVEYMQRY